MNIEQKRNVKIGVFAVGAFAVLCVGINYLKGQNIFSSGTTLKACYASVDGLTDSSPVIYSGFKVGTVKEVEIDQRATDPDRLFTVTLNIEKDIDIPVDSRAMIVSTDLLGGRGVQLLMGSSAILATSGDTVASGLSGGLLDELIPVKDKATALMRSADNVMRDLDDILDEKNRDHLNTAIRRMAAAMENIENMTRNIAAMTSASGSVHGTLKSASGFMESLNSQSGRIDTIMGNLTLLSSEVASSGLGKTVAGLDSLLSAATGLMSANGNISSLANDRRLYDNMVAATENLNRLLVDLRLNPSRYINVSAFKIGGKQIYFSDVSTASNVMRGRVSTVCLLRSKDPVDAPANLAGKKVLEYCYDGRYSYLVAPFASEEEAAAFIDQNDLIAIYPDAAVEVFDNGKPQ